MVVAMNLCEAIVEYAVRYSHCQEVTELEGEGVERIRRQFGEAAERLDRVVKVAEAAMALAEYQATSGYDPEVDSMTYTAERGRLWHAFIMARAKAANQQ